MAVASSPALKKGQFLTDGTRLVEVRAVRKTGIWIEDAATFHEDVIELDALGSWRLVEKLPLEGGS